MTDDSVSYMNNGGRCLERTAYWSQTITEVELTVPLQSIFNAHSINTKRITLIFKHNDIRIFYQSPDSGQEEVFCRTITGGAVKNNEATWYYSEDRIRGNMLHLLLIKCPPVEIYPGCEWWSHVFEGDEKIETLTCSIGSECHTLPDHAVRRRDREHARFLGLTENEKAVELEGLRGAKKVRVITWALTNLIFCVMNNHRLSLRASTELAPQR